MSFAWPWLLLVLPAPWVLGRLRGERQGARVALHLPFFFALSNEEGGAGGRRRGVATATLRLVWCLLVIAAARPQAEGSTDQRPVSGRDLLFVLDVSASMATRDLALAGQPVTRLEAAQSMTREFVRGRTGDRGGLIVFADVPLLHTPITWDLAALDAALVSLRVGLAGQETALGDAIALAVKRLREGGAASRVLVIVSDGRQTAGALTPQQAAWLAQREGIRVHSFVISNHPEGHRPLGQLAEQTGGVAVQATEASALAEFYKALESREPLHLRPRELRSPHELYSWPLALALLLASLAVAFRRYGRWLPRAEGLS